MATIRLEIPEEVDVRGLEGLHLSYDLSRLIQVMLKEAVILELATPPPDTPNQEETSQ